MANKRTRDAWEELIGSKSQWEGAMSSLPAGSTLAVEYLLAGISKTFKVVPTPLTAKENFRNNVQRLLNEKGESLEDLGNEVAHFRDAGFVPRFPN